MTDHEKLKRDIGTLCESVRLEWREVEGKDLSTNERLDLINHIKWCANELSLLLKKFEDLDRLARRIA